MPVVAVYCQAGAVPSRQPEGWVRRRGEAEGQRDFVAAALGGAAIKDSHLVVYCLGAARGLDGLAMSVHTVEGRVGGEAGVGGAERGLAAPVADAEVVEVAPVRGRGEDVNVALLDGGQHHRVAI